MKLVALALGMVGVSAHAMWTEDAYGNTIHPSLTHVSIVKKDSKKLAKPKPKTPVQISDRDIVAIGKPIAGQTQKDISCLSYSIFREAGTLPVADQYAVGQVHINRLATGTWGNHLCQVVMAKSQFSWTKEKIVVWSQNQKQIAEKIATNLVNVGFRVRQLDSDKILHYHADYVHPKWAQSGQVVAMAGPHIFYRDIAH